MKKKLKPRRLPKTRIVFEGAHVYLAVEDFRAGLRHVYTVYKLKRTGSKDPSIIGREVDLPLAYEVIRKDAAACS